MNKVQIVFEGKNDLSKTTRAIDSDIAGINQTVSLLNATITGFITSLGSLSVGVIVKDIFDANVALERMNNALLAATGSSASAKMEFSYIKAEANRLGLDLQTAALGFSQLAAAAKGTTLSGKDVRDVFSGVSEAATAMGLSSADTEGALRAVVQIMSKGSVQAEELRGQLGERIPGAFQIAARAMGVTTQELNKMLEKGEVFSDEFLPKFAAELRKTYAEALPSAVQSAQANLNRLKTSLFDLETEIGRSGFMSAAVSGIEDVTEVFRGLTWAIKDLNAAIGAAPGIETLKDIFEWFEKRPPMTTAMVNALPGGQMFTSLKMLQEYGKHREKTSLPSSITFPAPPLPGSGGTPVDPAAEERARKLREAIEKQVAALRLQAATLGMSAEEAAVYKLKVMGATESQLALARAALETVAAFEKSEGINKQLAAIKQQAETYGMTNIELTLYKLKLDGATESQLASAKATLEQVAAIERQEQTLLKLSEAGEAINAAAYDLMESLKTEEEKIRESYEKRRQIILNNTLVTGTAQQELLNRLDAQVAKDLEDLATKIDPISELWQHALENMQDAAADFFEDALGGHLKSFEDYASAFSDMVNEMVANYLAKMLMMKAFGQVAGGEGGGWLGTLLDMGSKAAMTFSGAGAMGAGATGTALDFLVPLPASIQHAGGLVSDLPRFHFGGLLPDERLIVGQTGERMLSRKQNDRFEGLLEKMAPSGGADQGASQAPVIVHMNVSALDARSFNGYVMQNKEAIAAAFSSARANNTRSARG